MIFRVFWGMMGILFLPLISEGSTNRALFFKNAVVKTEKLNTSVKFSPEESIVHSNPTGSYYIVQFDDQHRLEFKRELQKVSDIQRYIPDNAYVVKLKGTAVELETLPHMEWYGHYSNYLKVDQKLFNYPREHVVTVIIHLFSMDVQVREAILKLPIEILEAKFSFIKANVKVLDLSLISNIEGVEWVEEIKHPKLVQVEPATPPLDPSPRKNFEGLSGYASGAKVLNAEKLYQMNIRGGSEKITIADSGLDRGNEVGLHPDLSGRVVSTYGIGRPESGRWDDPLGHGTHVAGLVAGNGAASHGEVRGVAYEASLIIQSLFRWVLNQGHVDKGIALPSMVSDLFEQPYAEGARVHTNSWQYDTETGEYDTQSTLLDEFVWNNPDFVVLFAAGNSGMDLNGDGVIDEGAISVPATAKNCITVGASENLVLRQGMQRTWGVFGMDPTSGKSIWGALPMRDDFLSDNLRGVAAFSSRGPTADGRIKPDVIAPGTNNLSLRSRAPEVSANDSWGVFDEDYVFMGGTSMATPLVAGAAALVREYYKVKENRLFVSSALVKATLINGAIDLYPGQFQNFNEIPTQRPNMHEGFGRVDLEYALIPSLPRVRRSIDDTQGIKEREERVYTLKVTDENEPLRITMVYTDMPASPAVQRALVNDLDVVLQAPDGKKLYPNGLFHRDDVNNVENIDLQHPKKGNYVVRITAPSVPQGLGVEDRQPFSVVMSGGFEL